MFGRIDSRDICRAGHGKGRVSEKLLRKYLGGGSVVIFQTGIREYKSHIEAGCHVEHYAADRMHVDFAEDRPEVVDKKSSERKKAEVFVAILPFQPLYLYCEAVWTRREEDLIKGCENAMCHIEGVPAAIVPDNLKAAVTRSDRNGPVIHEDFVAFVEHTAVPSALPEYGISRTRPWLKTVSRVGHHSYMERGNDAEKVEIARFYGTTLSALGTDFPNACRINTTSQNNG